MLHAKHFRALGNNTQDSTRSIGMTAIFFLFVLENSAAFYSIRRTFPWGVKTVPALSYFCTSKNEKMADFTVLVALY
jgi:hypothetical protein